MEASGEGGTRIHVLRDLDVSCVYSHSAHGGMGLDFAPSRTIVQLCIEWLLGNQNMGSSCGRYSLAQSHQDVLAVQC